MDDDVDVDFVEIVAVDEPPVADDLIFVDVIDNDPPPVLEMPGVDFVETEPGYWLGAFDEGIDEELYPEPADPSADVSIPSDDCCVIPGYVESNAGASVDFDAMLVDPDFDEELFVAELIVWVVVSCDVPDDVDPG